MFGVKQRASLFLRAKPTDLRKGINGLYFLVLSEFERDPILGDIFIFINRQRTLTKMLYWDGTGFRLCVKMLAKGRFLHLWKETTKQPLKMTRKQLSLLMRGAKTEEIFPRFLSKKN